MSGKTKKMPSAAFAAATETSARRQVINRATGDAPPVDPTRVPVDQLVGSPENPREDLPGLDELAQSLLQHGLRQPLSVMPAREYVRVHPEHEAAVGSATFVVVNGHRRLAAAQQAGLATLAVHVTELDSSDAVAVAALVENIHREDLSPLEEASALRALLQVYGTNAEVARQVGKPRAWVGQRLALLNLAPELTDALKSGELKIKEARRLGTLPEDEQQAEWERLVNPVYNGGPAAGEGTAEAASDKASEGKSVNPVYNRPSGRGPQQPDSVRQEKDSPVVNPVYNDPEPDATQGGEAAGREGGADPMLTLDLGWEPAAAASEILSAYGPDRASALAEAIMDQL